jgi:hypothetical protein
MLILEAAVGEITVLWMFLVIRSCKERNETFCGDLLLDGEFYLEKAPLPLYVPEHF